MPRTVYLRRHTDADGDALTEAGIRAAVEIGAQDPNEYDLLISSGAQRATQTIACMLAGMGERQPGGVRVDSRFRSAVEPRWFEAAGRARGKDLEALREADPELVEHECALMGRALGSVFDALPEGGKALIVGHSPTTEAAVMGLTGRMVAPLAKGAGVRVIETARGRFSIEPLPEIR